MRGGEPIRYRQTWAEVSAQALRANVRAFRGLLADRCRLMAVVKADGYGHGMRQVAAIALEEGAERIGVAIPEEAFELRRTGITAPILILGYTPPAAVEEAVRQRIGMTVFTEEVMRAVVAACGRLRRKAAVHLKLDTGMTRLGVRDGEAACRMAELAEAGGRVVLEGAFTHFARAADADPACTAGPFRRYMAIIHQLEARHGPVAIKHCCNTAAALRFPEMHLDMVRIGIGLYGLNPLQADLQGQAKLALSPAMALKSRICHIADIPADETVSYGGLFRIDRDSRIAVLPVGYADGLPRGLSNRGFAVVAGKRVPIAGAVCMDQTMLDVTEVPEADVGMEAVLLGDAADASLPAGELAEALGTIHYELVTRIGQRVPRVLA